MIERVGSMSSKGRCECQNPQTIVCSFMFLLYKPNLLLVLIKNRQREIEKEKYTTDMDVENFVAGRAKVDKNSACLEINCVDS